MRLRRRRNRLIAPRAPTHGLSVAPPAADVKRQHRGQPLSSLAKMEGRRLVEDASSEATEPREDRMELGLPNIGGGVARTSANVGKVVRSLSARRAIR